MAALAQSAAGDFAPMYTGRFAPSPTGSLHLGSLFAAVGSFVDARSRGGRWLVRMEDIDRTRVIPGSGDSILRALEEFGLEWDGEVEYQSRRTHLYADALQSLRAAGLTFECSCSRRELAGSEPPGGERPTGEATSYPGTCRHGPRHPGPTATRFRMDDGGTIGFEDRCQGPIAISAHALGDVVLRRRDGVFAYQLAVIVDDALQGITDVVRGADLLDSTGWQITLQRTLGLPTPRYAHLPLILQSTGEKLAKSRGSVALDPERAGAQLFSVLALLGQEPPRELAAAAPRELLRWACAHWRLEKLSGLREIVVE